MVGNIWLYKPWPLVILRPIKITAIYNNTADLYSVKFVEFRAADNRNTINTNQ